MKRLAIIGTGSSGLITLKTALDHLPEWEIVCFEKSSSIQGCWGNPYPGFVSTSTKYTTQFSCFPRWDAALDPKRQKGEFFKGDEYGKYLEDFADEFGLRKYIRLNTAVESVKQSDEQWIVATDKGEGKFDQVIICTGLTEKPKPLESDIPTVQTMAEIESVCDQTVVIMGGGESAADLANRLAAPERANTVYLSLKGGIRVSPRYHPIKGVPSDFLRNRLMLTISQGLRNKIGQKFVETRIKYQEVLEKLFPKRKNTPTDDPITQRRKDWDFLLTSSAKDNLFNMFHNKSDGFLEAVGEERIKIIGTPVNEDYTKYYEFESTETRAITPDILVPMIGYQSGLSALFHEAVAVKEFYLGCTHYEYENLHLVGFARPIIGNIPSISEQQALYIIKSITEEVPRPTNITELYQRDRQEVTTTYPKLNTDAIYPVEMFPYCDTLARAIGNYPEETKNTMLSPASTLHYSNYNADPAPVYTPKVLNKLLAIIRYFDKKH